jgi:hypothetical protein
MKRYRIIQDPRGFFKAERRVLFFFWVYVDGTASYSLEECEEKLRIAKNKVIGYYD